MERIYSCFFTGHRAISRAKRDIVRDLLNKKIQELAEYRGVVDFICGGALGFDTLAAEAVLHNKKLFPQIRLNLYLPCYNQDVKWSTRNRNIWSNMIKAADNVLFVSECDYFTGCMQLRNERMADDAIYCLTYCTHSNSGTGTTIRYAQTCGCIIENLVDLM